MKFKILAILVAIMLASILLVSCDTEEQMTNSPLEFNDVGTESPAPTEPTPTEPAPTEPTPTEPHVHSYGEWGVKTPAECETNGVEERVCTCGESETRPIPATGHKYAETLSYDSTSHFYAAVCGCADQKKDAEPHIDTNNDGKCEVCAYDKMPVDTTVDKFSDIMQNMFL